MRRRRNLLLAWLACATLPIACSPQGNSNPVLNQRFDGAYVGTRTQEAACGGERHTIIFHVADSQITVNSRHKHRRLSGTVTQDGVITLTDYSGGRHVTGTITGNRIMATEVVGAPKGGKHTRSGLNDPMAPSCLWDYDAVRAAGPIETDSQTD